MILSLDYKYYQYIAAIGGWYFGGFIGAIAAFFLTRELLQTAPSKTSDYELCLLQLCTLMIKADGKVEQSEIDSVRRFFKKIFGEQKAKILFSEIKKRKDIPTDIESIVRVLKRNLEPQKYYVIIEFMFALAAVDGNISVEEEALVFELGYDFGFSKEKLLELKRLFFTKTSSKGTSQDSITRAYEILGIDQSATLSEVKKAYRKLSMEYHPDRLTGVSEAIKKIAQEKFIEIKSSYDIILNHLGQ